MLESEALLEPFEDRVEQPSSESARWIRVAQILKRLHREHRIGSARRRRAVAAAFAASSSALFDRQHLVDVGGQQLEDALEAGVRRDRLDPQVHPLEDRPVGLRPHVAQPQPPPLARVGVDQPHQRVRVLGDVPPALVEELERERHVRGIDVVHVAENAAFGVPSPRR